MQKKRLCEQCRCWLSERINELLTRDEWRPTKKNTFRTEIAVCNGEHNSLAYVLAAVHDVKEVALFCITFDENLKQKQ